jgi:hypothetical protein
VCAERPLRHVGPTLLSQALVLLGVEWIGDGGIRLSFADHQETHVRLGLVDEGARDAGARRETDRVAFGETKHLAVDPHVGVPSSTKISSSSSRSACGNDVRRPGGRISWCTPTRVSPVALASGEPIECSSSLPG